MSDAPVALVTAASRGIGAASATGSVTEPEHLARLVAVAMDRYGTHPVPEKFQKAIPMGRVSEPEEVAGVVCSRRTPATSRARAFAATAG